MNNPNGMNGHRNPPPRRRRRRSSGLGFIITMLCVLLVIAALIFIGIKLLGKPREQSGGGSAGESQPAAATSGDISPQTTPTQVTTSAVTSAPAQTSAPVIGYEKKELKSRDINKGSLILVNADNEYSFPTQNDIVDMYGKKSTSYMLSNTKLKMSKTVIVKLDALLDAFYDKSGKHDIMVRNTYICYDEQSKVYEARVAAEGLENAGNSAAKPGFSEHHTGLLFEMRVFSDGKIYTFSEIDGYDWVFDNLVKYGFVMRYPEGKTSKTGVGYEPWTVRYVGLPHSYVMTSADLCLEEYIDYLKKYTFDSPHLLTGDGQGGNYEIYYIPASADETTEIQVPASSPYDISGNNTDGFIVTVRLNSK